MKNQYILGIITGASLMFALIVFIGAKNNEELKYEVLNLQSAPEWLLNKSTGEVYMTETSTKPFFTRRWVKWVALTENEYQ